MVVGFDSLTAILVNNNTYTGWDSLNNLHLPDTIYRYPDRLGIALLGFDEFLHPRRLAEIYEQLPGVRFAEPNGIMFAGVAYYPWFPGWIDNNVSFLFPEYPNIPCNKHFYFKYIDTLPVHIGTYDVINDTVPNWWNEADSIKSVYELWDGF